MRSENDPGGQLSFIEKARRAQIVAAAIEVIASDGIGQASLARIASHAGVSKGVVSYHFAGKDELMRQVVVSVYEAGAQAMTPALLGAPTPTARLAAYLRSNLAFIAANPTELHAVVEIASGYRPDSGGALFDDDGQDRISAYLEELFDEGHKDGSFREFDPRVMARSVRGAIDAVAPQLRHHPALDLGAYAEELVTLFDLATRAGPTDPTGPTTPATRGEPS